MRSFIVFTLLLSLSTGVFAQDTLPLPNFDSLFTTINLDNIVVTAQYAPTDSRSSVFPVSIISKETIELRGASNLGELLGQELNISLNEDGVFGTNPSIQGMGGENVLILLDGIPMVGRQNGEIDLNQIPMDNIIRIERIDGPMSAIYGNNAQAGVINIISKKSQVEPFEFDLNTQVETIGILNSSGRVGGQLGKSFIQGAGRYFSFDGHSDTTSRSAFWRPKTQLGGDFLFSHDFGKERTLLYKLQYLDQEIADLGDMRRPQFLPYAFDTYYNTKKLDNFLIFNGEVLNKHYLDFTAGYSTLKRETDALQYYIEEDSIKTIAQDTSFIRAFTNRAVIASQYGGKIEFRAGYHLNYEAIKSENLFDAQLNRNQFAAIGDYSVFGTLQYRPLSKLVLESAVRFTYNTGYKAPITPSFHVKYELSKPLILRASYGRGFRAPSVDELYFEFRDVGHPVILGNSALKAETSHNWRTQLSYKQNLNKSHTLGFDVALFFSSFTNKIDLAQIVNTNTYTYQNFQDTLNFGVNLLGNYSWKDFSVNAGLSVTATNNDLPDLSTDKPTYAARITMNQVVKYHWRKAKLHFSLFSKEYFRQTWYYQDDGDNGAVTKGFVDPYVLMDFTANKRFWKDRISLTIGVHNILNVSKINSEGPVAIHSSEDGYTDVHWGRSFFGKIGIHWTAGKSKENF